MVKWKTSPRTQNEPFSFLYFIPISLAITSTVTQEEVKSINVGKDPDGMTVYTENPRELTKQVRLIRDGSKVTGHKE